MAREFREDGDMVLTDGVHLVSTAGLQDLHDFAASVGIKRCWFHPGRHPHYDLPRRMRGQPLAGAITVTSKEIVRRMAYSLTL